MLGVRQAAARSPSPDGAGIWCILLAAQRITRAFFLNGVAGLSLVLGTKISRARLYVPDNVREPSARQVLVSLRDQALDVQLPCTPA